MSRNKDIKALHEITGWSYKECRRKYRENGYELWRTLPFNTECMIGLFGTTKQAFEELTKAIQQVCDTFKTVMMSVDWQKVVETYQEEKRDDLI